MFMTILLAAFNSARLIFYCVPLSSCYKGISMFKCSFRDSVCVLTAELDKWGGHLTFKITLFCVSFGVTVHLAGFCLVWNCIVTSRFMAGAVASWHLQEALFSKSISFEDDASPSVVPEQLKTRTRKGIFVYNCSYSKENFTVPWKPDRATDVQPLFLRTHPGRQPSSELMTRTGCSDLPSV